MEKLMKTAKTMDKLLNFISKLAIIVTIMLIISVAILGIGFATGLDPDMTTNSISIDAVDFELPQPAPMSTKDAIIEMCAITLSATVAMAYVWFLIRVLRNIIKPMTEGAPFVGTVSTDIRKLGTTILIGGIVLQWFENIVLYFNFQTLTSIINESVAHVSVNYELIDSSCVLVSILVFMLSYVFRYGEELQQQADETL